MKHYCVTYYDGKGERLMYVQAKSINAAKAAANDLLRKKKVVGAAVRKAERISIGTIACASKSEPIPASEVARIIKERK